MLLGSKMGILGIWGITIFRNVLSHIPTYAAASTCFISLGVIVVLLVIFKNGLVILMREDA